MLRLLFLGILRRSCDRSFDCLMKNVGLSPIILSLPGREGSHSFNIAEITNMEKSNLKGASIILHNIGLSKLA